MTKCVFCKKDLFNERYIAPRKKEYVCEACADGNDVFIPVNSIRGQEIIKSSNIIMGCLV